MSRFGLRKKLKQALGLQQPKTPSKTASSSIQLTPQTNQSTSDSSVVNKPTEQIESVRPSPKPEVKPSEQDEKILKHRKRTKVALLKLAQKSGGTASLGDLHDLAERRYFIAHKAFSDLMEEMVAEGVFLYDWSAGEATLTDLGREWIDIANQ